MAKHRLFYSLLRLELPLATRVQYTDGLAFDFLADPSEANASGAPVMTGHINGLITMNIAEADDVERERRRILFGEHYRTLLGHFRHEIGHYFWYSGGDERALPGAVPGAVRRARKPQLRPA